MGRIARIVKVLFFIIMLLLVFKFAWNTTLSYVKLQKFKVVLTKTGKRATGGKPSVGRTSAKTSDDYQKQNVNYDYVSVNT